MTHKHYNTTSRS